MYEKSCLQKRNKQKKDLREEEVSNLFLWKQNLLGYLIYMAFLN